MTTQIRLVLSHLASTAIALAVFASLFMFKPVDTATAGSSTPGLGAGSSNHQSGKQTAGVPGAASRSARIEFANLKQVASGRLEEFEEPESAPRNKTLPPGALVQPDESRPAAAPLPSVSSPAPSSSFQALADDNSYIPPDTQGAVGPNHLIVTLNTQIKIQNRAGSALSTTSLNSFWSSLGYSSMFDPRVLYDSQSNRWVCVSLADYRSATSALLISASETGDPRGAWRLYGVDVDSGNQNFADYPVVGYNNNWIVVTVNIHRISDGGFVTSNIYVFNKAGLYSAGTGAFTLLQDNTSNSIAPALTYGAGTPTMYLVDNWNGNLSGNGYLRVSTITGSVGAEVLTSGIAFPSTPNPWADEPPGDGNFAPQLGSSQKINSDDSVIQNVVYRNGSLWCAQNIFLPAAAPTRSAIQWWQLGVNGAVQQRGRIDDSTGNLFYGFPSIAVNQNNDALIGYSRFSASQYASANYSVRLASDLPNTLRTEFVMKAGEAPYFKTSGSSRNKWGDLSAAVVDPVNDNDIWTLEEYAAAPLAGSDRWGTWWARVNPAALPAASGDIVLYASEAPVRAGNWTIASDPTAAGGARLWNPDAGAPKQIDPIANPSTYFEMTFNAQSATAYRLWIRGKAQNDSPYNDSVFVQFSGSIDANGTAVYRIGTTAATTINLEDDSGAGLSGWGWQDNGWGVGVMGPLIFFAGSGAQTIRVQVREDGLSIDQIVLSPSTYLNAAPGALKNDNTILPKQGGAASTPSISAVSPTNGSTAGGTLITITGANFVSGATVSLGATPATSVVVASASTITANTPSHAAGAVGLTVTNPDGQSGTLANGFTYIAPVPMPQFGHVFIVAEENHSYSSVIGSSAMPYLNSLANKYGLAINSYANTHPSIGNYFQLTAGQIVTNDSNFAGTVSADNIVRQLTLAGKTWKSYAESLPSAGYTGGDAYPYVKRHNPFSYFSDVLGDPAQAANLVPFSQFSLDLANNQLPAYSFIIPNQQHNSHDCPAGAPNCIDTDKLASADNWLSSNIQPLIASPGFRQNGLLIITFDESVDADTSGGGGHISTIVISSGSKPGFQSARFYQHENVLRTMAEALGLTSFPGAAAAALNMGEFIETAAPAISSISPTSGTVNGGTPVVITGDHFSAGTTVTLGGVGATNINVLSGTTINAATPPHAAGSVNVIVANSSGQSGTLTGGYVYTPATPAETILVADDFNDNSINTAKWNANLFSGFTDSGLPVAETNQEMEIGPLPVGASGSHYAGLRSLNTYDFTNAYCYVEVVQAAGASTSADAMLTIGRDVNGYYRIYVEAGSLVIQKRIGGSKVTLLTAPYNPSTDRYWRIRHEASSGKVYFETAPNSGGAPGVWSIRYNAAWDTAGVPLGAMLFELKAGTWQPETSPPGKVVFDNFKAARPNP